MNSNVDKVFEDKHAQTDVLTQQNPRLFALALAVPSQQNQRHKIKEHLTFFRERPLFLKLFRVSDYYFLRVSDCNILLLPL